jgi:hypothetical protein
MTYATEKTTGWLLIAGAIGAASAHLYISLPRQNYSEQ